MIRKASFVLQTDLNGREWPDENLKLFNVAANDADMRVNAPGFIPAHWHPELEFSMILDGSVQVCAGEHTIVMISGEGCFINSGVIHSFVAPSESHCYYHSFVFDAGIVGGVPGSIFDTKYIRPLMKNGPVYIKFEEKNGDDLYFDDFLRAFSFCEKEEEGYEFKVRELFTEMLLYVNKRSAIAPPRTIPTIQEVRLKQMLNWIDENLERDVSVKDIADSVNICPRECQRIFNRYLHYSPIAYLRRRRILNAARLLAETYQTVTSISLSCGFSSPAYFSGQFRQVMGCTPVEYRRACRAGR